MKKRWGITEFQTAIKATYDSISSRPFKEIQENERKYQVLHTIQCLFKLNNYHIRFFPNRPSKTIKRLRRHFPLELWEKPLTRKIIFEYWRDLEGLGHHSSLKDSLFRFIYGIQDFSTDRDSLILHISVLTNDLYRIHKLSVGDFPEIFYSDIDKIDALGNTPLMLAVKLRKHEAALVLIDHGADPKFRLNPNEITPIEQAIGLQDKVMLRILITGHLRRIREKWFGHVDEFVEALARMKNFSMNMRWECKSSIIPFVKRFTPSDVYQIYKRGKNVRIDLTLIGWESLKTRRGNISLLFNGHSKKLEIFDHVSRVNRDFDAEPSEAMIEHTVEKLLKNKKFNNEIQVLDVEIIPDKNWKGELQSESINNWKCKKKKLTCQIEVDREKKMILADKQFDKVSTVEEYLRYLEDYSNFTQRGSLPPQTIVEQKVCKHYSKHLSATLWTCDDFPLSLIDFLPILDLLSSFSKNSQHLATFFRQGCLVDNGFPVKALIPVYASVKLLVHLDSITMRSPDRAYFSFPKHEEIRSDDSTGKIGDWSSDFYYPCEVSCSDDDNLLEAQQIFLSLKSLDTTPLLANSSVLDNEFSEVITEEEMPEISISEHHHKLPTPNMYNRNSLPNKIFKKNELFKKVKNYAMNREKNFKNDADVVL